MRALGQHRAGAKARERTDDRARADMAALQMAEGADLRPLLHGHAQAEHHVRSDGHVLRKPRVGAEEHARRVGHRDAGVHRGSAEPKLHHRLRLGQLGPRVDAAQLLMRGLDRRHPPAFRNSQRHHVRQVVFPFRVLAAHGPQPAVHVGGGGA
jgi:hypothetical protein